MVRELKNELYCVKESNTELILKIQELELDKESARISNDAIMSAMEKTYKKDRFANISTFPLDVNCEENMKFHSVLVNHTQSLIQIDLKGITALTTEPTFYAFD